MTWDANYLIYVFMNITENHKNKGEIIKNTMNNWFQPQTIIKPPLLHVFISSVIQFDKWFHLMVLNGNYLICIFMKINKIFRNEDKAIV